MNCRREAVCATPHEWAPTLPAVRLHPAGRLPVSLLLDTSKWSSTVKLSPQPSPTGRVPVRRLNDRSRTCSLPNCCQAGGRVPLQARKRTTSVQQSSWLSAYVAANDIQSAELEPQVQGSAKLTNCGGSGSQSCSKTGSIVDMTPGTLHSPQLVVLQADFLYGGQDLSPVSV